MITLEELAHSLGGEVKSGQVLTPGPGHSHVDRSNDNLKDDLIRRTQQVWQPRLGRDLNREESRQIAANVTGFFSVLAEWSRAEMPSSANDAGRPDASEIGEARHDR